MSKGSQRRPRAVSREEYDLRYDFAHGYITRVFFDAQMKKLKQSQAKPVRKEQK